MPQQNGGLAAQIRDCLHVLEVVQGENLSPADRLRRCHALDTIMQYAIGTSRKTFLELTKLLAGYSNLLHSYAHTGAVQSIRENNPTWIQNGLTSLALEDLAFDWRDTLVILSLLGHSARKLSVPFESMIENATRVARKECAELILDFFKRPIEEQSIKLMGYRQGKRIGEFAYIEVE